MRLLLTIATIFVVGLSWSHATSFLSSSSSGSGSCRVYSGRALCPSARDKSKHDGSVVKVQLHKSSGHATGSSFSSSYSGMRTTTYSWRSRVTTVYPHHRAGSYRGVAAAASDTAPLDEAFVSTNGYFSVSDCSSDRFAKPELHILHTCKHKERRRLKVDIPSSGTSGHHFTETFNLMSYSPNEADHPFDNTPPCQP